ncbi:MAG: hypothetical protein IPK00_15210 [Deltaproteobacteria bacterium]|nr:hypothetical protein [Deltaproteobacteria bacterium]
MTIALRLLLVGAVAWIAACDAPESGFRDGSPRDALPEWIRPLEGLGAAVRPAWSADGKRFLYLDALVGDVFELDVASGISRPLTRHFPHHGFTRAYYLANGDLLLCGPTTVDPSDPERGRWRADFWLLGAALDGPARPLGERCFEGPAVARHSMRIAWVRTDVPDAILTARSELWTGVVDAGGESPRIVDARKLADRSDLSYLGMFEPQDFRPPEERELLFTAYAYRGGEAMGIDLETGAIVNYSRSPWYEEIEGVTPDGRFALVEREFTLRMRPSGAIDLWLLRLDGSGEFTRMTHFSEYRGFGANNPVVNPDCRTMLHALRETGGEEGNSAGLFVYDLSKSPLSPADLCAAPREGEALRTAAEGAERGASG